jgi:CubicO group peptidase (beta-lactamase class C family)
MQFLYAGNPRVLSEASRRAMQAPQANTHTYGNESWYGYGLSVVGGLTGQEGFYAGKIVEHAGGIPGYSSVFFMVPETGFGIVMLTSADGVRPQDSIELAFKSFGGLPLHPNPPANTQPQPGEYAKYVGTYRDPSGIFGDIVVTDVSGVPTIALPALDAANITYQNQPFPSYANEFFTIINAPDTSPIAELGLSGLVLTFVADERGRYQWLLLQNALIAPRVGP